ncbi:MAG TPA: HAD-IA family hydrolase [Conexibacter sp.]|nr:HAD-IA family hydrolase [Conexibacter sp.]
MPRFRPPVVASERPAVDVRALLLDALGTLVELEPPVEPLRRELRERFGLEVSEAEARVALRAEIAFYRAHHDEASDRERLEDLRQRAALALRQALPAAAGLPLPALTEALLAALRFRPFEEVPEVLRAARERGVRLVVISNWDVSLHDVLQETGLAALVDAVVTSAELGSAKPAGAIFARGLELAGVAAAAAVHVGDSVEHDVAGALAAGIEPLLVVREGEDGLGARLRHPASDAFVPPGVRTIPTLRPLLELVDGAGSVSFDA